MSSTDLDATRVHQIGLALHEEIRQSLRAILLAAQDSERTAGGADPALSVALDALHEVLVRHALAEDHAVAPVLADLDAWGAVRVERLAASHRAEADVVARASHPPSVDTRPLFVRARAIVRPLLAHLHQEERESLDPDLLEHAAQVPGQHGG